MTERRWRNTLAEGQHNKPHGVHLNTAARLSKGWGPPLWYGQQFADAKTAATCGNLLAIEPALWTFVRKNGDVEPTNNAAERGLRHGVLWRLTSFGTHPC